MQPANALVFVNDKLLGAGPQIKELEKGSHVVSIRKEGYISKNLIINLLKDSTINEPLEEIRATIELNTFPKDATLKNAGNEIGKSPLKFDLKFGTHEIEIAKEDYLTKKIKIEVTEPLKFVQNINLELDPNGRVAKKVILDYWNKKFLSNIGLSTLSLLGYLYFDNAVKENKANSTFLNQSQQSRSLLQTGKYACLLFCGMEAINSAFSLSKVIQVQKKKSSLAFRVNSSLIHTQLSLCVNF
jgi:hypothetical protein